MPRFLIPGHEISQQRIGAKKLALVAKKKKPPPMRHLPSFKKIISEPGDEVIRIVLCCRESAYNFAFSILSCSAHALLIRTFCQNRQAPRAAAAGGHARSSQLHHTGLEA